jgi:hypothetical protein
MFGHLIVGYQHPQYGIGVTLAIWLLALHVLQY